MTPELSVFVFCNVIRFDTITFLILFLFAKFNIVATYIIVVTYLLLSIIIVTHHPTHAKFICKHSKERAPERFFERHHYFATF